MMTRCECHRLSFVGLLSYARRNGITRLEDLMRDTQAGTGCGTCRPYLEELLRSGRLRVGDQLIELPLPNDDLLQKLTALKEKRAAEAQEPPPDAKGDARIDPPTRRSAHHQPDQDQQ
jgi:NAD(P)H-nitrite reductase large subunit